MGVNIDTGSNETSQQHPRMLREAMLVVNVLTGKKIAFWQLLRGFSLKLAKIDEFSDIYALFSKTGQDIQKSWPEKFLIYVASTQTKFQQDCLKNEGVSKNVIM